jgi:DNA-binding transcriptional regulator YdaS (Cro superfamily)
MDLKTYLKHKNITPEMFSRIIKVARSTVYNWIDGVRPHPRVAKKIEKVTHGEVQMKDLGHDG